MKILDLLQDDLADYHPYYSATAELLNEAEEVKLAYKCAIEITTNKSEQRYLDSKLDILRAGRIDV